MLTKYTCNFRVNFQLKIIFFIFLTFCLIGFSEQSFAQSKIYTVVLDAGHGGKDPGKVGIYGVKEKDIALKIVLKIGAILNKNKSIKVIYTRDKNVYVDLWKRGNIANDANADVFISVHCNAHAPAAIGSETWVLGLHANKRNFEVAKRENAVILLEDNYEEKYKGFDPNAPESVIGLSLMQEHNLDKSLQLASSIQKNFKTKIKRVDRGVKQAGFVVLYQTTMPSVLIETGFITHKKEGKYLNSSKGQREMASAIAKAINEYIDQLQQNTIAKYEDNQPPLEASNDVIRFKVQIASGKKRIATKSYNFKGLKNVERIQAGVFYKYYLGNTTDFKSIKKVEKRAKQKGFSSAFVVAFKNGQRISVKEALK